MAAALLARRDFSVLLLGHGALPARYRFEGRPLARRAPAVLFGETPAWRRVLQDLAQTQTFRRRSRPLEPSCSLLLPGHRLQISPDRTLTSAEARRELSEVHPVIEELWSRVARAHRALEAELSRDKPWPPESVVERLRARRWVPALPGVDRVAGDWLEKLPHDHVYRAAAFLPAWFATDRSGPADALPAPVASRLQHQWVNQVRGFDGGYEGFEAFLIDRIEAHGGLCALGERAEGLVLRRGRVAGVVAGGGELAFGADCVVTGLSGQQLIELADGRGLVAPEESHSEVRPHRGRFVVSCVVRSAGLPEPLASDAFVVGDRDPDAGAPALHLQRAGLLGEGFELLVLESIVPLSSGRRLGEMRAAMLRALCDQFPFVREHLAVLDSPHDGLPVEVFEAGVSRPLERSRVEGGSTRPEPLEPRFELPDGAFLGVCGESTEGPVGGTHLVGKTVFPGFGQEGELLAAWSVARRVTHADRAWQKRRRQMWTKMDTD